MRKIRKEQIEFPHDYESQDVLIMNFTDSIIDTNRNDGLFYAQFHLKFDRNEYNNCLFEVEISSAHHYLESQTSIDKIRINFVVKDGVVQTAFVNVSNSMLDFKSNQIQVMWRHDFGTGVVIEITEKGYLNERTKHWIDSIKVVGHNKRFDVIPNSSSATCNPARNGNAETYLFQGSDLELVRKISNGVLETFHSNKNFKITYDFYDTRNPDGNNESPYFDLSPNLIKPVKIYGLGVRFTNYKLLHFVDDQEFDILIERYRTKRDVNTNNRGKISKESGYSLEYEPHKLNRGNVIHYHLNSRKVVQQYDGVSQNTANYLDRDNIFNNGLGSYMYFNQEFYFSWMYHIHSDPDNNIINSPYAYGFRRKHTRVTYNDNIGYEEINAFVWLGLKLRFKIRGKTYVTPILGRVKMTAKNGIYKVNNRINSSGIISYKQ